MGARKGNEFGGIQVLGGVLYRMCGPAQEDFFAENGMTLGRHLDPYEEF